jgi:L-glyceraldehyde 3-phosphate reductase
MRGLDAVAKERGQTIAQLALAWVLREPLVASALIGASSVAQLEQNVAALDAPALTDEEISRIEPFAADGTVLA